MASGTRNQVKESVRLWPRDLLRHAKRLLEPAQKPWPSLSIVTPVFNGAKTIRETIESVLSQNYPQLE